MFKDDANVRNANVIEVAMPLGLYTSCEVFAPCSIYAIIGLLNVPNTCLEPDRMEAGPI